MVVYRYDDYKICLRTWLSGFPKAGRGQAGKLAAALNVSSVFISQVLRGQRNLNADQALDAAIHMGLNEKETEYFLLLVQESRAGTPRLKAWAQKKRLRLKDHANQLKEQISHETELSEQAKAIFYGHWHFSAVRLLTSLKGFGEPSKIAGHLQIGLDRVQQILKFLSDQNLVIESSRGWTMGPKITHLEAGSPFIMARQVQWRMKGFESMSKSAPEDLFFTFPASLDDRAFAHIRENMIQLIKEVTEQVRTADETMLACFNLDWFKL